MQWNCRGLISKWAEIKPLLACSDNDIVCLQETHFLPTDRYDFNLHNYTSYNCYSVAERRQGGACIYVSNNSSHFQIQLNTELQAVACSIRTGTSRLCVCSLYLPPNDPLTIHALNGLISQLPSPFLICADANSRHFLWGSDRCDSRGNIWEKVIQDHALNVVNTGCPTRLDEYTGFWSHIDITISSSTLGPHLDWRTADDLYASDHCPILITYQYSREREATEQTHIRWNLSKANWTEFSEKCDIVFDEAEGHRNCELMTQNIMNAAHETIPKKSGKGRYNCPWWTDECKEVIEQRERALNRFRRSRQYILLLEYKRAKAKARQVIRKAKKDSWQKLLEQFNHTTPVNYLWDIIRRFTMKERFQRPLPVLTVNGHIIDDPLEVGNTMGRFFSGICSSDNYRPVFRDIVSEMINQMPDFSSDNGEVYNCEFSSHELCMAITNSGNTSVGPDSLHYAFFKHMTEHQVAELLKLMNHLWCSGTYPSAWRHSILVPIPKPGKPRDNVASYRPIQLTSCLSKLMERMIANRLAWYIEDRSLLSRYQSAFRKGRCTTDHLIRLDSDVRRGFLSNKYTLAVFLDLKNAYNLTSTVALLTKLHRLGFKGRLMNFIREYLRGRTFQVSCGGLSDVFEQENGLVQGGVLSPILFNLMIDDIFTDVPDEVKYAIYADDCSLWVQGRQIQPLIATIQDSLDRISRWADHWGFVFSPPKCSAIIFRRYMRAKELRTIPDLRLYDQTIPYLEEVKFLGVILDSRLNLHKHIQYVKAKALRRMSILKCLSGRSCGADRYTLIRLYKAMIRPILEYACHILDGPGNAMVETLESVQNACLRIATGALRTSPVLPMLIDTDIYPLRLRRMDLTLRYCLKTRGLHDHPCHSLMNRTDRLRNVDKQYMKRMSGFPLYERMQTTCDELGFVLPMGTVTKRSRIAPWRRSFCEIHQLMHGMGKSADVIQVQSAFHDFRNAYAGASFIFTDGSKTLDGVGCAYVHNHVRRRYRLPDQCSIFTAEAFAILQAIAYIRTNKVQRSVICTDSLSVVMAIMHAASDVPTVIDIIDDIDRLTTAGHRICLLWIPGHSNISGNEIADTEAKLAISSPYTDDVEIHHKDFLPYLRRVLRSRFDAIWENHEHTTTLKSIKEVSGRWETSFRSKRREEVILCRLRLGHTRLTHSYLLEHSQRPECEQCDCPMTVQHILVECPEFAVERLSLIEICGRYGLTFSLKALLGNDHSDIIDELFIFLHNCDLMHRL